MYNESGDHMYNDRKKYFIFFIRNTLLIFLIKCAYNLKLIVCKRYLNRYFFPTNFGKNIGSITFKKRI